MSVHLMECAAKIRLRPAEKLVLLCFADSGDKATRVAFPGLEEIMLWSGLKRSQSLQAVRQLCELQLLVKHRKAHRGRRAEYVVFPNGCCEAHGKQDASVTASDDEADIVDVTDAESTGSGLAAPFSATGSGTDPAEGPVDTEKGSGPTHGKGPAQTGPLQESSPVHPSERTTPVSELPAGTHDRARETAEQPESPAASVTPLRGSRDPTGPGCQHCDHGWITDRDGLPVTKCPHCHPAHRQATEGLA